jgi:hypothetical protein
VVDGVVVEGLPVPLADVFVWREWLLAKLVVRGVLPRLVFCSFCTEQMLHGRIHSVQRLGPSVGDVRHDGYLFSLLQLDGNPSKSHAPVWLVCENTLMKPWH